MRQFLLVRKAFLIVALVFVLNYVFGTAVVLQMNLSDPGIGGAARDKWFSVGTPLGAPGWFMILYVILLVLATRKRWIGNIGIVGVSLLTLMSGLSWTTDWGLLLHIIQHHLTILTGLSLALLAVTTPAIVVLGILTLLLQRRAPENIAIPVSQI